MTWRRRDRAGLKNRDKKSAPSIRRVKMHLLLLLPLTIAWLNIGYYNSIEDAEIHKHYFIKKHPSIQIKFCNIHANNADPKPLSKLSNDQREKVIAYCKYRLGIHSQLTSEAELDARTAR